MYAPFKPKQMPCLWVRLAQEQINGILINRFVFINSFILSHLSENVHTVQPQFLTHSDMHFSPLLAFLCVM